MQNCLYFVTLWFYLINNKNIKNKFKKILSNDSFLLLILAIFIMWGVDIHMLIYVLYLKWVMSLHCPDLLYHNQIQLTTLWKILFKNVKWYTFLSAATVFPLFFVNPKRLNVNNHHCPSIYVQRLNLTITEFWQAYELYGILPNEIKV